MVIRYGKLLLADGDRGDAVKGLTVAGARVVQETALPGATYVDLKPRGNRAVTVGFEVTRLHADLATATAYLLELTEQLTDRELLRLTSTGAGSGRVERYLPSACLVDYEHRQLGCTTFHRFSFRAATITKTSPKTV